MSQNLFENVNVKEGQGPEEVILKILLQRHGPKLSAAGEKNAKASYFDASVRKGFNEMGVKEGEGLMHVSTSPVKRAVDSGDVVLKELQKTDHRYKDSTAQKENLGVPFQPLSEAADERYAHDLDIIVGIQKKLEPSVREKILGEYPNIPSEEQEAMIRNMIDTEVLCTLFDEKIAKIAGFQTSYEELADTMAKRYGGFLNHTGLLVSHKKEGKKQPSEPYVQIDISHSFPIMSFLKKYLIFDDGVVAKDMEPKEFFAKTGGVIPESGSFEMSYTSSGAVRVKGKFFGEQFSGILEFQV